MLVRDRDRVAVVVEDDRDRLPPVALTGEQPVAQLRGDHPDAGAVGFEPLDDRGLGVLDAQTVEERGVHGRTIADVGTVAGDGVVEADGRLHRTNDRQAELHREVPVAFVLGRHGHDGAGAVAHQDIVGDEHRDRLAVDRVRRVDTQIDARLLLVLLTVDVGHLLDASAVGRNGCGRGGGAGRPRRVDVVGVSVGDQGVDQRMLGCQHHVGGAEEGVGAGREDVDRGRRTRVTGGSIDRETDFGALRATDPVALHGLDRVRPVEQVEILEQAIGVGGDAHHPLLQRTFEDREVATVASAIGGDLFVGQHRSQAGAPVDRRLGDVGQPEVVQHAALLARRERIPGATVGGRALAGGELRFEFGDRTGLAGIGVEPGVEDLIEDPLSPAVVGLVGGGDRAALVVTQAQPIELAGHVRDVVLGIDSRMLTGLAGMFLGGQAEGVEPHGVQDVETRHALEAGVDVGGDVAEWVTDMEARSRGVREHVHDEQLRAVGDPEWIVGEMAGRVGGVVGAVGKPLSLPSGLELVRRFGVVAVQRHVVGHGPRGYRRPLQARRDRWGRRSPKSAPHPFRSLPVP